MSAEQVSRADASRALVDAVNTLPTAFSSPLGDILSPAGQTR